MRFPGGSNGKESACNAGDPGLIPGSGRSPGEGNSTPLQCSCLENSMDGVAWWATVHGVTKSWTRLSDEHFHFHNAYEISAKRGCHLICLNAYGFLVCFSCNVVPENHTKIISSQRHLRNLS